MGWKTQNKTVTKEDTVKKTDTVRKTDTDPQEGRWSGRKMDRDRHRHRDSQSELPTDLH